MSIETEITIPQDKIESAEKWLRKHVGIGGRRYKDNLTWLGADDWFYFIQEPKYDDPSFDQQEDAVCKFVFRRERDATMFKLKWG